MTRIIVIESGSPELIKALADLGVAAERCNVAMLNAVQHMHYHFAPLFRHPLPLLEIELPKTPPWQSPRPYLKKKKGRS